MAHKVADPCRNCGAVLAPGTSFCTLCGTAVPNRAAAPAPTSVPLVGQPFSGRAPDAQSSGGSVPAGTVPRQVPGGTEPGAAVPNRAPGGAVPGIIPVGLSTPGPLIAPQQVGGDARLAAAAALVPGGAGRRLAAKVIDVVPPVILGMVAGVLIILQIGGVTTEEGLIEFQRNMTLLTAAVSLLSLAYGLWLWIWEARTGKTPGNAMLGLRTTSMDGNRPGLLAVFLRNLIIGVASIVPVVGPVLVIISNAWDANGKWQGWHDKVAKTLVFNIKTGRNPMETGGVAGRSDYTPAPVPTLSPVQSPLPGSPASGSGSPAHGTGQGFAPDHGPITSVPGISSAPAAPAPAGQRSAAQTSAAHPAAAEDIRYSEPVSFAPPQAPSDSQITDPLPGMRVTAPLPPEHGARPSGNQSNPQSHTQAYSDPDGEAGETRIRPAANKTRLRLTFDDGSQQDIDTVALIGRNPAGYDGEMISRLVTVRDTSMSVSKTHLHVQASNEGLWVTDRNSTNGSAIAKAGGAKTALAANSPVLAAIGSRVHFGERSFVVGRA